MAAGRRNKLIRIDRSGPEVDDGYTKRPGEWAPFASEWAEVRFGTSSERREAAQEQASVSATFAVLDNDKTRAVTPKDRIHFDGGNWDIQSNVHGRQAGEREMTATRNV
jgi:head-tail adaptor